MDADGSFYCTGTRYGPYALTRFSKKPELAEPIGFGKWMRDKFYVDEIYDAVFVSPINALAEFFDRLLKKR